MRACYYADVTRLAYPHSTPSDLGTDVKVLHCKAVSIVYE